jgi:hypothetical protein
MSIPLQHVLLFNMVSPSEALVALTTWGPSFIVGGENVVFGTVTGRVLNCLAL